MSNFRSKVESILTVRPPKFDVVFIKDDFTAPEFMISVLQQVFNHPHDRATAFANEINTLGKAIVGTYNYEIAETKALEITGLARSNNFPLKVSLEQIAG